jgi:hypothetical protein
VRAAVVRFTVCEMCAEIDRRIGGYRLIIRAIGDEVTVKRAKEMIDDLTAQKAALHPEPEPPG